MPKNTDFCKIVATIGPDTSNEQAIESLVKAGVSVFRCNCSHGSLPEYQERVTNIRKMEKNIGALARTDAAGAIVDQVYAILDRTNTGEKK